MSNSKPEPPPQCAKPARLFKTDNAEGMGEEDEEVAMINMLRGAADLDEGSLKAPSPVDAESDGPRAPQSPAVKRAKAKINRSKSPSASQRRVEWHEAESEARRATQSDEDVHAAAAESMDRSDSKMNDARVRCMLEEVIDELATLSADADGSKGSLKPRTYFNITHDTGGAEIRSTEPPQPQPQPQPQTQPPRCASPAVQVRPGRDKKREKALSRHRKSSRSGSSQTSIVGSHRATNVPGQSPLEAPIFKINGIIREEVKDNKWKKRWLILDESHLYLFKSHEDLGSPVIINLMGGAVKRRRAGESGKCDPVFDVITTGQTYSFEAETEAECMEWVIAVTQVCEQLVLCEIGGGAPRKAGVARSTSPVNDEGGDDAQAGAGSAEIERLVKEDGNSVCADCGAPDPEWASVNIGAFLCIGCSGFHRSFGTHVSKVRSIRLDKWEEDHVSVLRTMGNIKANEIWEYDIGDAERITPGASNDARGRWLRAKYVEKRFTKEFVEAAKVAMPFTRATLKTMLLSLLAEDEEFRSEIRKLLDKE